MYNLLEKYPYATEAVRDWFMEKMIESFKDESVPNDFKDFMRQQGIPNDKLALMIQGSPRVLFDVFDDNKLIINVVYGEQGFSWHINDEKSVLHMDPQHYFLRKDAERIAVEHTFKMLDEKLNIIVSETKNDEGQDSTASAE